MEERYSIEEIKDLFQNYRDQKDLLFDDDQYEIFCTAISFIDKNKVDEIYKQIFFSYSPKPCYYINFASKDFRGKKGFIYFKPLLFDPDTYGRKIEEQYYFILHEIGHHIFGHKDFKNSEEENEAEIKANEFAIELLKREDYSCEFIIRELEMKGQYTPPK